MRTCAAPLGAPPTTNDDTDFDATALAERVRRGELHPCELVDTAIAAIGSALPMPQASFGGVYLHTSLAEMAAAYLFHLAQTHPFVEGNKRAALATALAFIWLSDRRREAGEDELTDLVMGIAAGRVGKADAAVFFSARLHPSR